MFAATLSTWVPARRSCDQQGLLLRRSNRGHCCSASAWRNHRDGLCEEAIQRRLAADLHPGPYIAWDPERARAEARLVDDWSRAGIAWGPLHGIPISIKDVFGVAGYRTYAGCPRALPQEFEAEGEIVRSLRRQGMVMMGKTHSVQFAFGALGVNSHHGTSAQSVGCGRPSSVRRIKHRSGRRGSRGLLHPGLRQRCRRFDPSACGLYRNGWIEDHLRALAL